MILYKIPENKQCQISINANVSGLQYNSFCELRQTYCRVLKPAVAFNRFGFHVTYLYKVLTTLILMDIINYIVKVMQLSDGFR